MVEHVPFYPLAPLLFLVAAVVFALLMARHLRVLAPRSPARPSATSPAGFASLFSYAIVQVRMFRDLDAGIMHAAIFWGFVDPDRRHGRPGHVRARPRGPRAGPWTAGCGA